MKMTSTPIATQSKYLFITEKKANNPFFKHRVLPARYSRLRYLSITYSAIGKTPIYRTFLGRRLLLILT